MTSQDQVGGLAERQARELDAALTEIAGWPSADVTRVGAVGHSFGARATLLLAMRETRVAAVVSLDGGIGTATAMASFRAAPSFNAARARAPILHYYERLDAFMAPDFALLDSLPAQVTKVLVEDLHHVHFTTLGFAATMVAEIGAATGAGPDAGKSLLRVAEGTLEFLRRHLTGHAHILAAARPDRGTRKRGQRAADGFTFEHGRPPAGALPGPVQAGRRRHG